MGRVREQLAQGGIALLASAFALAYAAFGVAGAVANEVISVLLQHVADNDGRALSFTVFDTTLAYGELLRSAIALGLLIAGLLAVWALGRSRTQECHECLSQVPVDAAVCRHCTSELAPEPSDA